MSRRLRSATKTLVQAAKPPSATPVATAATSATAATTTAPSATPTTTELQTQLFQDADAWQSWLETNHTELSGLWLKISKKGSGIVSVTYDEAVDTALCFGWIDGQKKSSDENHFLQRFTPRRKNSIWSKRNVGKVAVLTDAGRMRPGGQREVDAAKADGRWDRAYSFPSNIQVPADLETALNRNKKAKVFFEALNRSKRYAMLLRIEMAKRPETRRRKIDEFVQLLADHKTL